MRGRRVVALIGTVVALLVAPGRPAMAQGAGPLDDVARALLQTATQRVVQSVRDVAPGLVDRIDSILASRRSAADAEPISAGRRTGRAVVQVVGVSVIGLVIALVVLVTALGPLEGIIRTVEADVGGAFWRGLLAQVIALPLLSLLVLALALTLVGLLLVPIVLLVATLVVAGVGTLGLLAVAAVLGRARATGDAARSRAGLLRALLTGYALLWAPWFAAAALVAVPGLGVLTRLVALASTWGMATVGTGAVLRSRGGLRVPEAPQAVPIGSATERQPDWSTPTPVAGVVASPRP